MSEKPASPASSSVAPRARLPTHVALALLVAVVAVVVNRLYNDADFLSVSVRRFIGLTDRESLPLCSSTLGSPSSRIL